MASITAKDIELVNMGMDSRLALATGLMVVLEILQVLLEEMLKLVLSSILASVDNSLGFSSSGTGRPLLTPQGITRIAVSFSSSVTTGFGDLLYGRYSGCFGREFGFGLSGGIGLQYPSEYARN
ncbi:hypothetical protein CHS0354_035730 [Potamilus streckersoni]|uniref:Uncharacterized protein n=1 Tax=Potamilus streckersoni TaxID=2493646 RepID=A0AAE0VLX8_9BIVA|nr:hypothetical protein CHS0354_035730 [Potamilus streckersoni]